MPRSRCWTPSRCCVDGQWVDPDNIHEHIRVEQGDDCGDVFYQYERRYLGALAPDVIIVRALCHQ